MISNNISKKCIYFLLQVIRHLFLQFGSDLRKLGLTGLFLRGLSLQLLFFAFWFDKDLPLGHQNLVLHNLKNVSDIDENVKL